MTIMHPKFQRYLLIPSRDVDVEKIIESDWTKGAPSSVNRKAVVTDATFPC